MSRALPPAGAHQEPGRLRAHLSRIGRAAGKILGRHRQRTALVQEVGQGSGMESSLGQVVCRRPAQSFLQLSRPPRADLPQEQGRTHLGERTRRSPHPHLPATASRSAEVRQRPEIAWRQKGRPRRHLHGHDARAADRHAGLRPHRRAAHGGLRWIFLQRAGRSHSRLAGRGCHYAGWLVPSWR